ncbi:MAG: MFS transporter [Gemmatimonadetes bacterium]|nr:MFS transporter [Gemmatimonadota bacterium]MBT5146651.1 MFS transporter [Gemmatimonadota bacterium]MBT5587922.1 MFS transporter [Gemmatimonadota bacterium]MBT5964777.1 MFS transporter [Gemmatimonadota bacterium]MBT7452656.1 MFS transporter [Gemmatimonadota bacterium]
MTDAAEPSPDSPYAVFRIASYRDFTLGSLATRVGTRLQSVAMGWDVYQRTGEPLALGLVGLIQVIPAILLALPAGWLADRFDRQRIILLSLAGMTLTSAGLALQSYAEAPIATLYGLLFIDAVAGTMGRPARTAILPRIVPRSLFPRAVTWNMSLFQLAAVIGPGVGGFVVAWSIPAAYAIAAISSALFALVVMRLPAGCGIPEVESGDAGGGSSLSTLFDGVRYVWRTRVLLAILSLDMFAVLLGGAVFLLPIFAEDILRVGATGLGWLHAAPAMGALLTALAMTHLPPLPRAGRALLICVGGFGVATIIFGLSTSLPVSLVMLFLTGAFDQVSMVVRHTMVQLITPDAMRGRVSAVNGVFVSTSNELGGFESGLVAHWFGPIVAVVSGGIGTIFVVAVMTVASRQLRGFGSLGDIRTRK